MLTAGVRFMLISTLLFAVMNVLVKYLDHLPAVEIAFFRSIGSLSMAFGILRYTGVSLPGNNIRKLLLRGFFGSTSLILYFITLHQMPLASAVTIQFLSPIFTAILGIFLVSERVRTLQWFFFLIAFAGVLLIQGFDTRVTWGYLLLGIGSAIFSALAYNTIRMLKESEHPLVIVFYFPLISLPITGFITAFNFVMPKLSDWPVLIVIGIITQFAQYFMTRAFQLDELSKIASIRYVGIVWALIFGYVFFGEIISFQVQIGIACVLFGVVLNLVYKHYLSTRVK